MKEYDEQNYPISLALVLRFDDGEEWEDGIKGLNIGHALYRVRWNWPGVTIVSWSIE